MKVVSYSSNFNLVINNNTYHEFLEYPQNGQVKTIKVVNDKVFLSDGCYLIDLMRGKQFFYRKVKSSWKIGVCVVYCIEDCDYFYMPYDISRQISVYEPISYNFKSKDWLRLRNDFDSAFLTACSYSYIPMPLAKDFFEDDFPFCDYAVSFNNLPSYQFNRNITSNQQNNQTQIKDSSGLAVCACGYVSEFVENDSNYVCQQCKLWNHIAN